MAFGKRFLTRPGDLPDHAAGEPWGDRELVIDFAGGPYRFRGLSAGQEKEVLGRFGAFSAGPAARAAPAVEIRLLRSGGRAFRAAELDGSPYSLDLAYDPSSVRVAGFHFLGHLEWREDPSGSVRTSIGEGDLFQGVFENYFRVLVAYRLLQRGGTLVHSAGIVEGEGEDAAARLFFGRSGAGKSTLSKLALDAGRKVLSDDLNALCRQAGRTIVERVPFAGDLAPAVASGSYPLRAMYRLSHGRENVFRPMSPGESLAALIACCPYANSDPHRVDRLAANLETLLRQVPTGRLAFVKDADFGDLIGRLA